MDTQKKPAGLRNKGAVWMLAAFALLFGMTVAGCGEDPATADEIAAAVVAKEQAEKDAKDNGNNTGTSVAAPTTLQSAFVFMLKGGSMSSEGTQSVDTAKALTGEWTQTDAAYTVSSAGTNTKLATSVTVYKSEKFSNTSGQYTSYTVTWKVKTAADATKGTLNLSGNNGPTLTATKAGEVTAVLDFQMANTNKRGELISGTVTLKHTLSEADVLESAVTSFESQLFQTGQYGTMPVSDWWAVKPLTGTWGQADAKYTATMKKPSSDGTLSFPNGAVWTVDTSNTTAKGFKIALSPTLDANTDATDQGSGPQEVVTKGKLTLKFTLTDAKVSGKKVEGTVEITVVD